MADIKKVPYTKGYSKSSKGQAMVLGLMILVMGFILFIAMLPAIKSVMDDARGCDNLNCAGYVDKDATSDANCGSANQSYNATFEQEKLSCTILDLGIPYLILGVLVVLITKLISGRMMEPAPEAPPQYGYGGY